MHSSLSPCRYLQPPNPPGVEHIMASGSLKTGIQLILWVVIAALGYFLYLSITEPYKIIERQKVVTEMTRDRMDKVRMVAIQYESQHERFPSTIDSLVIFAKMDSLFQTRRDSLLGAELNVDSLIYSPRTGKMFTYTAVDTSRVKTYLLEDPDSDDKIGTLLSDVTLVNAASWE